MNWIVTSVLGAFFQNARSSIQKKLNTEMSLMASTYVRFAFSLPILFVVFFRNFRIILKVSVLSSISLLYTDSSNLISKIIRKLRRIE